MNGTTSMNSSGLWMSVSYGQIDGNEIIPCLGDKKKRQNQQFPPQVRDIQVKPSDIIPSSINGRTFVFTGDMDCMSRIEAAIELMRRGAIPSDNITRKTDYLVIGNECYNDYSCGTCSSKIAKANEYKAKGNNISLITEAEYLILLEAWSV